MSIEQLVASDEEISALILHAGEDAEARNTLRNKWGEHAVRISEINLYLARNTSIFSPLPHPPRFFISYRWESDEHRAWVHELATGLARGGFAVTLDQWEGSDKDKVNIPKLVAELGRCHRALLVVTPEMLRAISFSNSNPGWVYYEYHIALLLSWHGRLRIDGVVRDGNVLDAPNSVRGLFCQVIDLRQVSRLDDVLGRYFSYHGPILTADSLAEQLWQEGSKKLAARLFDDAERVFSQAVELYPEVVTFWSSLAFTKLQLGKKEQMRSALENAYRLDQSDSDTLELMAEMAYAEGEHGRAKLLVQTLLSSNPMDPRADFILGNILDDEGKYQEALAHLTSFIKRRPRNARGFNNCGMAYLHLGRYDEAIKMFDRAIELDPYSLPRLNKANTLRLKGEISAAILACEEIIREYPDQRGAQRLLSLLKN